MTLECSIAAGCHSPSCVCSSSLHQVWGVHLALIGGHTWPSADSPGLQIVESNAFAMSATDDLFDDEVRRFLSFAHRHCMQRPFATADRYWGNAGS